MIIKRKAYFLKKDIDIEKLKDFGFYTYNEQSYWRDTTRKFRGVVCYKENRIIKLKYSKYNWSVSTRKFIEDLIKNNMVEKKNYYYWFGWNSRNYSDKKMKRIEQKLTELNGE